MAPDISEFSYGFALTHELVGRVGPLHAAPVFPSLIEEGRAGGGYDVHLDLPGFPLFLQFKRADCMVRASAWEYRSGYITRLPFYRFKITEKSRSAQHELLLQLDDGTNVVFYVAPLFHSVSELDDAYVAGAVANRSFFVRPGAIGSLDNEPHHVAFNETQCVVCSEPRKAQGHLGDEVFGVLRERLRSDTRPFRDGPLAEAVESSERAMRDLGIPVLSGEQVEQGEERLGARSLRRGGAPKSTEEEQLRILADRALRSFNAQLFIVQELPREHFRDSIS